MPHSISLFRSLPDHESAALINQCRRLTYLKNEYVVRHNDIDTNFYIIESGKVRVTLFSSEGKEVSFIDLNRGENFGEFSAIDGQPRSANVIALEPITLLIMPRAVFLRLVTENPIICVDILNQLTAMIRRLCDRIFEYSTLDVSARIQQAILKLAKENIDLDGVARIYNPPTQAEIASRLTCNREAVSREYSHLELLGIMQKRRGTLIFNDLEKFENLLAENKA